MAKKVELLAPAGNYEAFLGAVNAGADAVYLGGERFGARAYAENFKAEEILRALHVAHFYGKRIYLTVNTLLKEREIAELSDYLYPFYEAGLDGVIVQDFGAMRYIREHFPGLSLHASTQMTVTGVQGAALLKEVGITRIVPARELSLQEVRKIREEAGVEVECFIHGAMCYCYSGQCLFSSMLGGRSGNRGRCAQPCRLPYEIWESGERLAGEGYPLSLKDMCTLESLPVLIEAGIDSFKIEGRMKRPEYAAGVTAVYRKYIDRYYEEGMRYHGKVEKTDLDRLKSLYIRSEIQTGYYERHNGKEMIALEKPGYADCDESLLAEIRQTYLKDTPKMPVKLYARAAVGEPLRVRIRPAAPREDIVIEIAGETVQAAKNAPLAEEDISKRLSKTGESLLVVTACEIEMEGEGFVPVRALNELRREAVKAFEAAVCEKERMRMKGQGAECAVSGKRLRSNINEDRLGQSTLCFPKGKPNTSETTPGIHALVTTVEQLRAAVLGDCERIYIESDLFLREHAEVLAALKDSERTEGIAGDAGVEDQDSGEGRLHSCYLALPYILRERDEVYLQRLTKVLQESAVWGFVRGFLVRNLEGLAFARGLCGRTSPKGGYSLVADAGLYCFNKEAAAFLAEHVDEITLPYELNAGEAAHLVKAVRERKIDVSLIVYSHIPMMITANCLAKTADACRDRAQNDAAGNGGLGDGLIFLKDRKEVLFPVVLNCEHCYNILYNCVPYSLHGAIKERERIGADALRYDFTVEPGRDCRRILNGTYAFADYTAGHCKRGVE